MGGKNYCAAYIFIFLQHTALMFIIVCIYFCFNHRVKTVLLFNSVKTLLPGFFFSVVVQTLNGRQLKLCLISLSGRKANPRACRNVVQPACQVMLRATPLLGQHRNCTVHAQLCLLLCRFCIMHRLLSFMMRLKLNGN